MNSTPTPPGDTKTSIFMAVLQHSPDQTAYGFGNTAREAALVLVEAMPSAAGRELDVIPVTPGCGMRDIDPDDPLLQHITVPASPAVRTFLKTTHQKRP